MKIELTEEEIKKRANRFIEKAVEEGNDLRDTDRRISDDYKALANKMLEYIAE